MTAALRHDYIRALIHLVETHPSEELFTRIERLLAEESEDVPRERKANGEGSVYLRGDGRWTASIRIDGRRRVIYGRTYEEAKRLLDVYIAENMVPSADNTEPSPEKEEASSENYEPLPGEREANEQQLAAIGAELAEAAPADDEHSEAIGKLPELLELPELHEESAIVALPAKTGRQAYHNLCADCGGHTASRLHKIACIEPRKAKLPREQLGPVTPPAKFTPEPKSEISAPPAHAHRWQIDPPNGPMSSGRCACGATKEFGNSPEALGDGSPSYWDTSKKKAPVLA